MRLFDIWKEVLNIQLFGALKSFDVSWLQQVFYLTITWENVIQINKILIHYDNNPI